MTTVATVAWPSDEFMLDLGDRMLNMAGPHRHGGGFSILTAAPGPFAILSIPEAQDPATDAALRAFDRVVRGGALGAARSKGATKPNRPPMTDPTKDELDLGAEREEPGPRPSSASKRGDHRTLTLEIAHLDDILGQ